MKRLRAYDSQPKKTQFQNFASWEQKTKREEPRFRKAMELKHERENGHYFDKAIEAQREREQLAQDTYEKYTKEVKEERH